MPLWIFAALGEPRPMARDEGEDLQNRIVHSYGEPSHSSSTSMQYNIAGLIWSPVSRDGSPLFQERTINVCDSRMQVFYVFYESFIDVGPPSNRGKCLLGLQIIRISTPLPDAGMLSAGVKICRASMCKKRSFRERLISSHYR